jgi:ELWxxDGT repeat protein
MNLRILAALALAAAVNTPLLAQAPFLVADLNTSSGEGARSSNPMTFLAAGDKLYFTAQVDGSGRELWRYHNGTATMVADIAPSGLSSTPAWLSDLGGGLILFRANDSAHGQELWRTDGTAAGTSLVKDIHPTGNGFSSVPPLAFNGRLFFVANDGVHGAEPWVSDGTEAGTQMLLDLNGTSTTSGVSRQIVLNDKLLLFAPGSMWSSDGTPAGTTSVATVYGVLDFGRIGSTLFFNSLGQGGTGRELWKTDGTQAGTQMVTEIIAGPGDGVPADAGLVTIGSTLYFAGMHDGGGVDLWKTDGTAAGTQLVKMLTTDPTQSIFWMTASGNTLLFELNGAVWRSDGTAAGTYILDSGATQPEWPIGLSIGAHDLVEAFGRVFYLRMGPTGDELWSTDGSTIAFVAVVPNATQLTATGGKLYLSVFETLAGAEPWVSEEGTTATTHRLVNVSPDLGPSSSPEQLTVAGNLVYFRAYDGATRKDIWRSDGTAAGTFRLTSMGSFQYDAPVSWLTGWNGALYFRRQDMELWRSDGTVAGTALLKQFTGTSPLNGLFAGSQHLYMNASNGGPSGVLWRTDGTAAGTITLGDLLPSYQYPGLMSGFTELAGRVYSTSAQFASGLFRTEGTPASTKRIVFSENGPSNPKAAAGALFFIDGDYTNGSELWRSDGTAGTERVVKDIAPGNVSSEITSLTAGGRYLFFVANDGTSGAELWRTDGTAAGTILLGDIRAGGASSSPANLTATGELLYFTADDGTHGVELWRTDGTVAGTVMVSDLRPGSDASSPAYLTFANGSLWFSANDGVAGAELWRLAPNGTLAMVADLAPGSTSSFPQELIVSGQRLYFAATTSLGRELWAMPLTDSSLRIADAKVVEGTGGTRTLRFTVTRDGSTTGPASATFATLNGTATASGDYLTSGGSVTFASGEVSRFIDIVVQSDANSEENESLFVILSAPSGAVLGRSIATGVIEDDDRSADLSIVALDPTENVPSLSVRQFRISNAGPSAATDIRFRYSESPRNIEFEINYFCGSLTENPITCNFEALASGASIIVNVQRFPGQGSVANHPGATITASVSAAEPDANSANNTTSRMESFDGRILAPPSLTSGTTTTVRYSQLYLNNVPVTATLQSSVPGVVISPPSVVIPVGQRFATFTVTVGAYTGPVLLTGTPSSYEGTMMTMYVVAPGNNAKLDTAIDAEGSSITYGDPGTITVNIAARRHDGTRPTGNVTLLDQSWNFVAEQSLDATATTVFTRTGLLPGNHGYFIRYAGDANFQPMEYAQTGIFVSGWPTDMTLDVPPLICAGTPREIFLTVRTSATTTAPTGTVEVTLQSTMVTLPLTPTGVPGESRAVLQHSFTTSDFYLSARYLPTGTFKDSNQGQHFQTVACVPMNVKAAATSNSSVAVTWSPVAGAHHYEVIRSVNRTNWSTIGSTPGVAFNDTDHDQWIRAHLYTVRALDAADNVIGWGSPDIAMNMMFTNDPVVPKTTGARAAHITELRVAANALRWFGSNVDVTAVPPMTIGSAIRAADFTALRTDINALRRNLGMPTISFTTPALSPGTPIQAIHLQELRDAVK